MAFFFPLLPTQAQSWQIAVSGSPSATSGTGSSWTAPTPATGTLSLPSYSATNTLSPPAGQALSGSAAFTAAFRFTLTWQPGPGSAPAPTAVRVSEIPSTGWSYNTYYYSDGTFDPTGSTADDGFKDAPVNLTSSATHVSQPSVSSGSVTFDRTLSATCKGTVTTTSGGAAVLHALLNSYTIQVSPTPGVLKVDQDQQVFAPAPTTRFSATVSNASGCTIDWIKISVDGGSSMPATIPTGSSTGYIDWNSSSAGNPSEHTVTATAQIHDSVGTVSLDSTRPEGNGRPADDIIADMRLKSIQFTGNIGLTQNATTPVSTPELTWDPATGNSKSSSPAAYVQGKTVGFTMTLCDSKGAALAGSATAGYTLKLQANPNATNAATGQPAPPLTLYDNTTASPVAPTAISGSTATVKATAALNSYVARYTTTLSPINFYVKFTHVTPTPTWRSVSSPSPSGNTLYAVVATPTAPMATPWVPVLDYACQWATGATDATSATTALTNSEFNKCTYDDRTVYTDLSTDPNKNGIPQDGQEVFSLQHFLNNTLNKRNQLTGDCRTLADFLCCLSNSVGATPLQVQRSASVSDILNNSDRHCFFTTNYGFQAPPVQGVYAQTVAWVYHQWATSNVYDGAFEVSASNTATVYPTGVIPLANKSLNDYKSALVNTAISPCFWRPQTAFAPSIVN